MTFNVFQITAVAGLSCFLATGIPAQTLTPSEQAAKSQRATTDQERARQRKECILPITTDENPPIIDIGRDYKGPIVKLDTIRMLGIISLKYNGESSGDFNVSRWPDLPNGGLAGFDTCAAVELQPLRLYKNKNDTLKLLGLGLRDALDLEADYPNAIDQMKRTKQVISTPAGHYVMIYDEDPDAVEEWIGDNYQRIPFVIEGLPSIKTGNFVFVPINLLAI